MSVFWHHSIGISICLGTLLSGPAVKKYAPPVAMIECSTVFASSIWILRTLGMTETKLYKLTVVGFAASFFSTRIIALPYSLWKHWDESDFKNLGPVRWLLLGLTALNIYWAKKIVEMARKAA